MMTLSKTFLRELILCVYNQMYTRQAGRSDCWDTIASRSRPRRAQPTSGSQIEEWFRSRSRLLKAKSASCLSTSPSLSLDLPGLLPPMASSKASLEKIVQRAQSLNQNVTLNVPQIRRNPLQLHEASVALASKKPLDERAKSKGYVDLLLNLISILLIVTDKIALASSVNTCSPRKVTTQKSFRSSSHVWSSEKPSNRSNPFTKLIWRATFSMNTRCSCLQLLKKPRKRYEYAHNGADKIFATALPLQSLDLPSYSILST